MNQSAGEKTWFLYLIRCNNGRLYTGISTDVQRRLAEHEAGKGAKFLRGKGPLAVVFQQPAGSRSEALKAEAALKKLSRTDKEAVVQTGRFLTPLLQAGPEA